MGCDNVTIDNNSTEGYHVKVPLMLVFSILPMLVNIQIVLYIFWIKKLKPKTLLTISLAIADAISSLFYFVNILVNSYLEVFDGICVPCPLANAIMICWQSLIIIGIYHILALSLYHYVSIVRPMKYKFKITRKRTFIIITLLWTLPTFYTTLFYLSTGDKQFWFGNSCKKNPTADLLSFRISYLFIFSIILPIIIAFYSCIIYSLNQQNIKWMMLSREGSRKNCRNTSINPNELVGYKQIVITTILILISYVIGWLPHLIINALICRKHCIYNPVNIEKYSQSLYSALGILPHVFILLKGFINPFIYASRIKELKEGRSSMHFALKRKYYKIVQRKEFMIYPNVQKRIPRDDRVHEQLFFCESTAGSVMEYSEVLNTHL